MESWSTQTLPADDASVTATTVDAAPTDWVRVFRPYESDTSPEQRGVFRFLGVPVPDKGTVLAARLKLRGSSTTGVPPLVFSALGYDDAPAVSAGDFARATAGTPVTRTSTSTVIEVDVTGMVQAVIDRPGWVAGGAVTFRVAARDRGTTADLRPAGSPFEDQYPTLEVDYLVTRPPVAAFVATVDELAVTVTDMSTDPDGDALTRVWDMGDGTTVEDGPAALTHTYATAGAYTVTLTVTDPRGATGSTQRAVVANRPPLAAFTYTIEADARTVVVDASASYDPDPHDLTRTVDWGDGTTSTGALVHHTYTAGGHHRIGLTVTDPLGGSSTTTTTVSLLQAAVAATTVGLRVTGRSRSVTTTGRTATLRWDFGDGTPTVTGPDTVTHDYQAPGTYTVTLTVTEPGGATDTTTATVTVTDLVGWRDVPADLRAELITGEVGAVTAAVEVLSPTGEVLATLGGPHADQPAAITGRVTCDATRLVRWTADLTLDAPDLIPTDARDLLHPLAHNLVRLWWLTALPGGGWGRECVGTYPVAQGFDVDDNGPLTIGLSLMDVTAEVARARWPHTMDLAGFLNTDAAARIIGDRAPWATVRVIGDNDTRLPRDYQLGAIGGDPWEDVVRIAEAAGMVAYADRYGTITIAPKQAPGPATGAFAEGPTCTVTALARSLSADDLANMVLVESGSNDVDPPVHAWARDTDPLSPISIDRGHYYFPPSAHITSGEVTTTQQAGDMALAELARRRALLERVKVTHMPDPSLQPGETVLVARDQAGVAGLYEVQSWSLTLPDGGSGGAGSQETVMAEQRRTDW